MLLEFPFRCKPLSKRGDAVPLPGSLDGPGDPANETETHYRWSNRKSRSAFPAGPPTGVTCGGPQTSPRGKQLLVRAVQPALAPHCPPTMWTPPSAPRKTPGRRRAGPASRRGCTRSGCRETAAGASRSPGPRGSMNLHSPPLG